MAYGSSRYFAPVYFAGRYWNLSGEEAAEGFISARADGSSVATGQLRAILHLSGSASGLAAAFGDLTDGLYGDDDFDIGGSLVYLPRGVFSSVSMPWGCSMKTNWAEA